MRSVLLSTLVALGAADGPLGTEAGNTPADGATDLATSSAHWLDS